MEKQKLRMVKYYDLPEVRDRELYDGIIVDDGNSDIEISDKENDSTEVQ